MHQSATWRYVIGPNRWSTRDRTTIRVLHRTTCSAPAVARIGADQSAVALVKRSTMRDDPARARTVFAITGGTLIVPCTRCRPHMATAWALAARGGADSGPGPVEGR